jgi:hypothetical protein
MCIDALSKICGSVVAYLGTASGVKNLCAKTIFVTYDNLKLHGYQMSELEQSVYRTSKGFKQFLTAVETPKKIQESVRSGVQLVGNTALYVRGELRNKGGEVEGISRLFWDAKECVVKTTAIVDPVWNLFELSHGQGVTPLTSAQRNLGSGLNAATLIVGMTDFSLKTGVKIFTSCQMIADADMETPEGEAAAWKGLKKLGIDLIEEAKALSYLALGIIGVLGALYSTVFAQWIIVACATTALVCTLGGHFYTELVDPYEKGLPFAI